MPDAKKTPGLFKTLSRSFAAATNSPIQKPGTDTLTTAEMLEAGVSVKPNDPRMKVGGGGITLSSLSDDERAKIEKVRSKLWTD